MRKPIALALAAGLAAAVTGTTASAVDAEDAIEYRQGVFQVIKWDFGPMVGMAKGKIPFDAEAFAMHAERVAAMAPRALEGFVEGSSSDDHDTDAKAEIWADWDKFEGGMQKLENGTAKLAEVAAGGDEMAMKKQLGEVGKTCKGCHDNFREE